jgi:hypothetical protein
VSRNLLKNYNEKNMLTIKKFKIYLNAVGLNESSLQPKKSGRGRRAGHYTGMTAKRDALIVFLYFKYGRKKTERGALTYNDLGQLFNVSESTIQAIVRRTEPDKELFKRLIRLKKISK